MPQYRFRIRHPSGEISAGVLAAETAGSAASILREQGHHILQLVPAAPTAAQFGRLLDRLNVSSGPGLREVLDFTTQLAVMTRAGIGIRQALEGIAEQAANPRFRRILHEIRMEVEGGRQFSEAIARFPKLFSPLYVSMVRASEMSGSFSKMLDRIAAYLAQEVETRRMVIGASIYPGLIALMAVSVTLFLLTWVLPRFGAVFAGREEALPAPTLFLMGLSAFMVQWWWLLAIVAAAGGVGLAVLLRTATGRWWLDRLKLSCPLLNRMFKALYISRSLHTMGELLNAGVPVLDTIAITGEESGKLGEVLGEVSAYYHRVLRDAIKTVTGMIEPLMIVVMGSCVGFIAMAIILPIFKMSSLVTN